MFIIVYYESIKRRLKIRGIYECRCDESVTLNPKGVFRKKIKIETPNKDPLSSVLADNSVSTSTSTTTNAMMTGIFEMMSSKMDDMIDKLDRGNGYSDKLVKAMA
jgi:hypothetical protein